MVSCIIRNFNNQNYLGRAIRSCLNQTLKAEVIVVDDASTDKSWEVIDSFKDNIQTDFTPEQLGQLACLGTKLPLENIAFSSFPEELFKQSRIKPDPYFDNPKGTFVWDVDFDILREYVTRFNAVLGSRAEPETALYELADLSTVWVIASVHEQDVAQVRVGMTARFAVTGQPGVPLDARVELLQPTLDESTRTSQGRLALPNPGLSLRPGQYGEVSFELPATEGLLVPRDAVIHTGEHEYVYVATGDADFEPRLGRTGVTVDAQVHVLEGLAAGDRVVSRGSFMLDSESRLQASLAAAPAAATRPSRELGADEKAKLEALGYTEGDGAP